MKLIFQLLILIFASNMMAQNGIALVGKLENTIDESSYFSPEKSLSTSFELFDRMIVIDAKLNGHLGKYILDTGSPILIINQTPKKSTTKLGGISGEGKGEFLKVKNFQWAGVSNQEVDALAFDMSNLEKALGHKINGLIGQSLLKNYEVFLDISKQKIQLFKAYRSLLHKTKKYKKKISFSMKSHIPIITVKIDGKKYKFGIDTGAEINILNKKLKNKLNQTSLNNFKSSNLHGLDGISQQVESATLINFSIKKEDFNNYEFLLTDLSSYEEKYGQELDGILGHPFLLANILSINYPKQKIYIW